MSSNRFWVKILNVYPDELAIVKRLYLFQFLQGYELVKDYYDCTHRGKIYAKNIGEIDMYFVHREKLVDAPREIEVHDLSEHLS